MASANSTARAKAFRAATKAGAGVITGVAVPVALHDDGTACWGIDSVHGQSEYPEHLSDVQLRNDPAKIEKEASTTAFGDSLAKTKTTLAMASGCAG